MKIHKMPLSSNNGTKLVIIRLLCYFTASMKKYHPAPWIYGKDKEQCPTYIWYWVREGEYGPPRSCMEVKTRSIGKEGVSGKYQITTGEKEESYPSNSPPRSQSNSSNAIFRHGTQLVRGQCYPTHLGRHFHG